MKEIKDNVTAPRGFKSAGVHCGIKPSRKDFVLIVSESVCSAAGIFTLNKVKAAPVLFDIGQLKEGKAQVIAANSGNANSCTGKQGERNAEKTAELVSKKLGIEERYVLVCSTGVIGKQMQMEKIEQGIETAAEKLSIGGTDAAEAIMTTDLRRKEIAFEFELEGRKARIGAVAKGAGMIDPSMATMLCFITTDVDITSDALKLALLENAGKSFNSICVDGEMSTNDSVIALASGMAGNRKISGKGKEYEVFSSALGEVMLRMAKEIVLDGEGATKFITIDVRNSKSESDAKLVGAAIARSALFKTAMFGEDANWGRAISAAGASGADVDQEKIDLYFNGTKMCENGMGTGKSADLSGKEIFIEIDLKLGKGNAIYYACDLSYDYVRINAEYET